MTFEEKLEEAYWNFDKNSKATGEERLAFKGVVRNFTNTEIDRLKAEVERLRGALQKIAKTETMTYAAMEKNPPFNWEIAKQALNQQ